MEGFPSLLPEVIEGAPQRVELLVVGTGLVLEKGPVAQQRAETERLVGILIGVAAVVAMLEMWLPNKSFEADREAFFERWPQLRPAA